MAKKNVFTIPLTFIVSFAVFNCGDPKLADRPYPIVNTYPVTDINNDDATLHGEIAMVGEAGISDHGFTFGQLPSGFIGDRNVVSLGARSSTGSFVAPADRDLVKGKTYYVTAYAITEGTNITVYGEEFSFVSAASSLATLDDITPKRGSIGDTVTLTGTGFSDIRYENVVRIAGQRPVVTQASEHSIRCVIGPGSTAGPSSVTLVVGDNSLTLDTEFTVDP